MQTTDTLGRPVTVTTGLTTDLTGEDVIGLAIGGGPSAVITLEHGARLQANLRKSLADLRNRRDGAR